MTERGADSRLTRYYRSFSAHWQPVQPQGQIEYSQARELPTYYAARYDEQERLVEFVKQLRVHGGSNDEWQTVFMEVYQYAEDGGLRRRTLKVPGQNDQIWEFTPNQRSWSDYLERLCGRWFRGRNPLERPGPARLSLLVHEQYTELEAEVFEAAVGVQRDHIWARNTTQLILDRTRDIVSEICPYAVPRICAWAKGRREERVLVGFDEPVPNLYGIVESWREEHPEVGRLDAHTLLAQRDLDLMGRRWAAESNIGSITFAPIRIVDRGSLTVAAMLFLLTAQSLSKDDLCLVDSIFRRLLQQIQSVLETARAFEASGQESQWP